MKKIFFAIAVLISNCTFAQSNELYHLYKFGGKAGVTDSLNNDILTANYNWYVEELYGKKKWIFKNENQTEIFSRENGTNESVEKIRTYRFTYKNEMYMQITDDGKDYLLSHHSDTRFDLPKGRENIETVGDYFYITEMASTESKSVKDKKTGLWLPPKKSEPQNQFQFFKNPSDAKPVLKIFAIEMNALWKDNNYNNFDYIAFTTEKQIKIYDVDLKLIKSIPKPNEEYIDIDNLVSKTLGQEVYQRGAPPKMPMDNLVEYPLLTIRKQGGQNQVILERKYADNNPTLLFTTSYEVSDRKNTITIKKEDKNFAQFDVNLNSGKIYYPKLYLDQLGLDFTEKNEISISENQKGDNQIYTEVGRSASFSGGPSALAKYIRDNLKYPIEAVELGISGEVIAKFIVEKDGSITNIKIVKSLSKECDAEVIRIIKKIPRWIPAILNGGAVRSYYELPVIFVAQ